MNIKNVLGASLLLMMLVPNVSFSAENLVFTGSGPKAKILKQIMLRVGADTSLPDDKFFLIKDALKSKDFRRYWAYGFLGFMMTSIPKRMHSYIGMPKYGQIISRLVDAEKAVRIIYDVPNDMIPYPENTGPAPHFSTPYNIGVENYIENGP